jgi:hypothetical protein
LFVEKPSLLELWNEQKTEANAEHLPVFFVKPPPRPLLSRRRKSNPVPALEGRQLSVGFCPTSFKIQDYKAQ